MRLVIDIETDSNQSKIWLCVTQNIDTGEVKVWKAADGLWDYIADATSLIGHNLIGFDGPILNRLWKTKIGPKKAIDTLILSRLLDPSKEQGHSLEAWGKELGGEKKIEYGKIWEWMEGRRQEYPGECFDKPKDSLLLDYCVRDCDVTRRLYLSLVEQLQKKGFSDESVALEHRVAAIIAEQERNGFKLDVQYATMLLADIQGKLDGIYEAMQQRWPPYEVQRVSEKTGKQLKPLLVTFNPGSRKQIGEKLIELGWKPKDFTETGQPKVDELILDQIIKDCSA